MLFARILREKCAHARRLACVDYHTGLGPSGIRQLLLFHQPGSAVEQAAKSVWGERAAQTATGESIAYRLTGSILGFLEEALPATQVIAGAYEFGTLPPARAGWVGEAKMQGGKPIHRKPDDVRLIDVQIIKN